MPIEFAELVELDRRAVLATSELATTVGPADLDRPTPCAGWTVRDLLAHMTSQQVGFAAAARGGGGDLRVWGPSELDYEAACADVLAAFAGPEVAARGFALPEIRDGGPFPAAQALSFHLVDNAVHAWDLAAALDRDPRLDDTVITAALAVAESVPGGDARTSPGAAFAPALPVPDDTAPMDRMLRLLGRDPGWAREQARGDVSRRTPSR